MTAQAVTHALMVIASAVVIGVLVMLGRGRMRRGDEIGERRVAWVWAMGVIVVDVWSLVYWVLPGQLDIRKSLPLELCDLAALVAPVALLLGRSEGHRWSRRLLYFWGLGLSTQAFITPTTHFESGAVRFWLFWALHAGIVGSALYDVIVRRFRPTGRDLMLGVGVTAAWCAGVFLLNIALGHGANYGYVGQGNPGVVTIVDVLGAWPLRVVWMSVIVIVWMTVLWGVWGVWGKGGGQERAAS